MFVINGLGQLSWCSMGQNLKLLQPWWNFSTAKSSKKKKKSCVKLKNWAEWGSSGAGFMAAQYAVGPGAVETCAQREERVSEAPSKAVPHCHLQGCRPSSAVSHLYFSSGAAVPAQTTYFENQSQLRQNLTAQVQDSDGNCLLPSDSWLQDFFGWLCLQLCLKSSQCISKCSVSLTVWAGRLNFTGEISSRSSHHLLLWRHKV